MVLFDVLKVCYNIATKPFNLPDYGFYIYEVGHNNLQIKNITKKSTNFAEFIQNFLAIHPETILLHCDCLRNVSYFRYLLLNNNSQYKIELQYLKHLFETASFSDMITMYCKM